MAKAKEDTVLINIPLSEVNTSENTKVYMVNGKRYEIKMGEDVEVPRFLYDIIRESDKVYRVSQTNENANKTTPLNTY